MSKLALTTTAVQIVELRPKQRVELQNALTALTDIRDAIDALEVDEAVEVARIEGIRVATGLPEFEFESSKVTRVEGETTYFDKDMVISKGWMSPTQMKAAHKKKPKKAYTLVTPAGRKQKSKGED